ncbi:hypothetical protein V6U89_29570 [Micromonospora sp. CPCC 206171]|uniref:hypothetical protein n=1 Tax=Micromonospora sp. CPCC 206171 TaxID=3122405 RepID=UPI002FF31F85
MARGLDVRRLAAIDMWGSAGARWRRWIILAEFLLPRAYAPAPPSAPAAALSEKEWPWKQE